MDDPFGKVTGARGDLEDVRHEAVPFNPAVDRLVGDLWQRRGHGQLLQQLFIKQVLQAMQQ